MTTTSMARTALLLTLLLSAGCAGTSAAPAGQPGPGPSAAETASVRPTRTLVMAGRSEIPSLASRPLQVFGLSSSTVTRLFNAGLSLRDGGGNYLPYLAEALPQLGTDTWAVSADGHMQTTYHLRPGLVWQDGVPLTADDFVFALEVYRHPEVGQAASSPIGMISQVLAPDARTLVVQWGQLFPDAGNLDAGYNNVNPAGLPPLPRHLLDTALREGSIDAFIGLPFWTTEYVGLGPYRIDHWEAGAYFEAAAFDQHVLGRPHIERLRMLFIPDFNASLAHMLAGEAHITVDDSIRFQQGLVLRREWAPRQAGTVLVYPGNWRHTYFQQRTEFARPLALREARIRQALLFSLDKQALSDALFEGEGILADTPIPPTDPSFAAVEAAAVKYPYDLRRSEGLMVAAGYARGADGVWVHPAAGRLAFQLATFQSPQNENEMHIMADSWRQAGFDVGEQVFPAVLATDQQLRDTLSGLVAATTSASEGVLADHASSLVPTAQNRWTGPNRGGWTNEEFDGLAEQLGRTLARPERAELLVRMARVFTADAAVLSLYFNVNTTAFVSSLRGPKPVVPDSSLAWDIYEWDWVS